MMRATVMHSLIHDIAISVGVAWLLAVMAQWIRQPSLLAYLLGGFLLGPSCLKIVHDPAAIETVAELGLLLLLFMIGLEIDLKKIVSAGRSITLTAASQILGGFAIGLVVFRLFGFSLGVNGNWDALYLAVAAAGSSTVIIVKLLYDQRELDTLAGRITLGVVVLQDLFSILFLAVQPNLNHLKATVLLGSLVRVVILIATSLAVARYILPRIFRRVARMPELLLVGSLAWCFAVGELAAQLQLSREMGALIAGVALSTFPYALDVTAKVTTLRDFFVTLFFVGLGMQIPLPTWSLTAGAIGVAVFTIASRLVTTFTPLYLMRTGLRISLLPAIYLAQISEFSLVILALGLQAGHISPDSAASVSLAFVLLAVGSTFTITRSDPLVRRLIPVFSRIGLRDLGGEAPAASESTAHGHADIVILGFFRTASSLLEELTRRAPHLAPRIAVVDFNPVVYEELKRRGVHVVYGDISQPDTLTHAGAANASLFICTIPDSLLKGATNEKLVRQLRALNEKAKIISTADTLADIPRLRAAGADYVSVARLGEARDLCEAVLATTENLLDQKQTLLDRELADRAEVLP